MGVKFEELIVYLGETLRKHKYGEKDKISKEKMRVMGGRNGMFWGAVLRRL